jgi:predicted dehydrogenase
MGRAAPRTINWGIIGCGKVCEKKSGPALYGVPGSRLVAVMRRTRQMAEDFARRHKVPRFYDRVEDLLADGEVEAVYVATPDAAHEQPTIAAARAGKHVLVEKAMAVNTAACDRMIRACRDAGVVLAVAYYRRGYPTILRAKALIEEGAIGALREVRINDEFPLSHRLDLLHFLCGEVAGVSSRDEALPPCSHAPSGPMLYCRHRGGALGITPVGWDENLVPETLDIRGASGRVLVLDLKQGLLVVHRNGKKSTEDLGPLPATHWGIVDNFVKHLNGQAPLACDGVEGRKSTVILDIVEALRHDGGEVAVHYE